MATISSFGRQLKEIRKSKKLSVRALAEMANVSHSYLSQVENGHRGDPSPEIIKKISEALDYDYYSLMRVAGYIEETKEFEDPFEKSVVESYVSFKMPFYEDVLNAEDNVMTKIRISPEERKRRFLRIENLLTMDENVSVNDRILTIGEKKKIIEALKVIFKEDDFSEEE